MKKSNKLKRFILITDLVTDEKTLTNNMLVVAEITKTNKFSLYNLFSRKKVMTTNIGTYKVEIFYLRTTKNKKQYNKLKN